MRIPGQQKTRPKVKLSRKGFTIVELMIALSVLSTILVMTSVIMIQIGGLYSKGVNAASLQNTSRAILSDVSAAIQFSSRSPVGCDSSNIITCFASKTNSYSAPDGSHPTVYAFCVNTTRYSYVLNRELGDDQQSHTQTPHVLWKDTMNSPATCSPLNVLQNVVPGDLADPSKNGFDLVPARMRLTRFRVTESPPNSGVYAVDIWMAYGDSDLVQTVTSGPNAGSNTCSNGTGTQYCSTSSLSTSVTRRVD